MTQQIDVENLGPISKFSFGLREHGVTVLVAPNGSGKSILLDAMSKLARGNGKAPLRDGAKRGSVEGFGARLSIGATSRHTGEFQVTSLEGRFDLAELVDPGLIDPVAADRKRIRALVSLSGAKPDAGLFAKHPAFGGTETMLRVVGQSSLDKTDLVEMAESIKRDYEQAARKHEDEAQRETGEAKGIESSLGEIDPAAETDQAKLRAAYDAARDTHKELTVRRQQAIEAQDAQHNAQEKLQTAQGCYQGPTVADAEIALQQSVANVKAHKAKVEEARKDLAEAEQGLKDAHAQADHQTDLLHAAAQHEQFVHHCQQILGTAVAFPPSEAITAAEQAVTKTQSAMEYGVLAANWRSKRIMADKHRERASAAEAKAEQLRAAAQSIDEVLSGAIKSAALRVESVDGRARLVVDHAARGVTPYHELSDGERWRVAIDLAADKVGEDGLIVIPQAAFEGLDHANRLAIHQHAIERKVFILTAEATHSPDDAPELQAKAFEPEASNA